MGRFQEIVVTAVVLLAATPGVLAGAGEESDRLPAAVARALESGERNQLAALFPSDRKVRVSLSHVADLEGYTGSGPLVEAFRRYLSARTAVHFDPEAATGHGSGQIRVRGLLRSRDSAGKRERIVLTFVFERIGGAHRAVEVRESG